MDQKNATTTCIYHCFWLAINIRFLSSYADIITALDSLEFAWWPKGRVQNSHVERYGEIIWYSSIFCIGKPRMSGPRIIVVRWQCVDRPGEEEKEIFKCIVKFWETRKLLKLYVVGRHTVKFKVWRPTLQLVLLCYDMTLTLAHNICALWLFATP